jgi:hypothetical protein
MIVHRPEFVEELLHDIALAVEGGIDRALDLAVALGGNVAEPASRRDQIGDRARVLAVVGHDVPRRGMGSQQVSDRVIATRRPQCSTIALILVLSPPRERPRA